MLLVLVLLKGSSPVPPDTSVVARVGRFSISTEELLGSYEVGPAFVRRSRTPLRKHLEFMIFERLLAFEAERVRLDTTMFVRTRVHALEEDLAVDELYNERILSQIQLSEDEIEQGIGKARMNLRMRWIYAKEEQEARRIAAFTRSKILFDSLFALQIDSSTSESDRSLETTLLKLERDNPELAKELAGLRSQEVSGPIRGKDGFYIIRFDEVWQNPLASETEYVQLKDQSVKILRTMNADRRASEYVTRKMKEANPILKADGFNILAAYIAGKGLSKDTRISWKIPSTFMTEAGPRPISESSEFLGKTLVTFSSQALTVEDYARWYDVRQFQLKTESLAAFNASLKQTVWKMVQDRLLSSEAYENGLQFSEPVRKERSNWEIKMLYLAGRAHALKTMSASESRRREHYDKHPGWFKDAHGNQQDYEAVRENVRRSFLREEEIRVLSRLLQNLQKQHGVFVDEEKVRHLEKQIDLLPIDVIFYKPGGTFPRVAFPTIDDAWKPFE